MPNRRQNVATLLQIDCSDGSAWKKAAFQLGEAAQDTDGTIAVVFGGNTAEQAAASLGMVILAAAKAIQEGRLLVAVDRTT